MLAINNVKTHRFYKEGKRWYVDLPEWMGTKADLEMVFGADTMLDIISNKGSEVKLNISLTEYPGATELKMLREGNDWVEPMLDDDKRDIDELPVLFEHKLPNMEKIKNIRT